MHNQLFLAITFTKIIIFIFALIALIGFWAFAMYMLYRWVKGKNDRHVLRAQLEIQEQTFCDISKEIHDNIGQKLSLARLQVELASRKYDAGLEETASIISTAVSDLRDLSQSISGDIINEEGLAAAIKKDAARLEAHGRYTVPVFVSNGMVPVTGRTGIILYRVFQEAVQNILKHSAATTIHVSLIDHGKRIAMSITDNGTGFKTGYKKGGGLKNMQERVKGLEGKFAINSSTEGAVLSIEIPVKK